MRRSRSFILVGTAIAGAVLLPDAVGAFLINPLKDRYQGGTGHRLFDRVRDLAGVQLDSVHEDITYSAEACVADAGGRDPAGEEPVCSPAVEARRSGQRGNWGSALTRGVWWNDDPNQHLYVAGYATWYAWMEDAESIARTGRNLRGQRRQINATYKMQYRSHFGDLQFLHAQANANDEEPAVTQARILGWMEFAYRVAIEEIPPERRLGEIALPIVRDSFSNQASWTVNRLFAPKYVLSGEPFGDLALGSMLHVVQDSFAAGHNRRAYDAVASCGHGRVVQFTSYIGQNSDRHSAEDTRAALQRNIAGRYTRLHNPVEASARLIMFVRAKADWATVVEPYLRDNLFCVGPDAERSGPGGFE